MRFAPRVKWRARGGYSDGRLFVHPDMKNLHEEGNDFPVGFLDALDCLAAAKRMLPRRQTTHGKIAEREREIEMLKRQGTPFGQILERVAAKYGK